MGSKSRNAASVGRVSNTITAQYTFLLTKCAPWAEVASNLSVIILQPKEIHGMHNTIKIELCVY